VSAINPTYATLPGAPTIGTATAGHGQASVAFGAPADDGGAAIGSYTVAATDLTDPARGGHTASGTTTPITVTGLTNGDSYTFTVTATSFAPGPPSASSNAVTPQPLPKVSAVSPNAGPTKGGTAITITGTGFVTGATVVIGQGNGTTGAIAATSVKVVSPTEITAVTGGGAKAGTFSLFVTTSAGTSAANSGADFTYH
jgi:hypothetical protein